MQLLYVQVLCILAHVKTFGIIHTSWGKDFQKFLEVGKTSHIMVTEHEEASELLERVREVLTTVIYGGCNSKYCDIRWV